MPFPFRAILWALSLIGIALLAANDVISESSATTMMVVLPALAMMQLSGRMGCGSCVLQRRA